MHDRPAAVERELGLAAGFDSEESMTDTAHELRAVYGLTILVLGALVGTFGGAAAASAGGVSLTCVPTSAGPPTLRDRA
ncbi:MAG: hypothetical protein ABEJ89_02615 [Haloarculaceae archaeon]